MGLAKLVGKLLRAKPAVDGNGKDSGVARATPIRGFTVLGLAYPNHLHPESAPMTAYDIALRLSYDMDVEWFSNDHELKEFACTGPVRGNADNDDAFGFDFGRYDRETHDFILPHTVIVRETAGGGFMLLIQDNALAFGEKTRALFDAIAADHERENPEVEDDSGETPS